MAKHKEDLKESPTSRGRLRELPPWHTSKTSLLYCSRPRQLEIDDYLEKISNTLDGYFGKVFGSIIQFSIGFIHFLIFELSLNLRSCPNKGNSIH